MTTRLAARIRAAYPEPVSIHDRQGKDKPYCVLGAVNLWLGRGGIFPHEDDALESLRELNPALTQDEALDFAADIRRAADDTGDFDRAWRLLDEALEWRP